ncbi:MAG: PAS domain S-box protein, partial [Chitinophagaceae bacterium]|nr:PAS domain S-box protein [Chitinophagaceae bacterium]
MNLPLRILLLEDSIADAELIQRAVKKSPIECQFRHVSNREEFLQALDDEVPDLILSDNTLPQYNATEALQLVRARFPHLPFILITGTVSEEYAASIIKQGADDYILKDRLIRLPSAIEAALKQRRAEKEIADYRYALDHSAIVAITDQKGVILYANDNFCTISKYDKEELLGQDHRIINSAYHPAEYIRELWVTIAHGKIWRGEFRNRARDGTYYWVDTTIIPFLNEKGKPYQYLSIRIDITARKKAEEELQESNERFKYATQAVSDIIWELNFDNRDALVHEGMEKLYGPSLDLDWQIAQSSNFVFPADRERVREGFKAARNDPQRMHWQDEYRIYNKDSQLLNVINNAIFIRDNNGKALRAIGAITDITERKKLEEELIDRQRREQQRLTAIALEAQEKERNTIGEELHDNVNQILVGAKLLLSMIKNNPEKHLEMIGTCIGHIQNAIEENRKIAHELSTPDFGEQSLSELIVQLTQTMLGHSGVEVDVIDKELNESLLSDDLKLTIYRIAQEQCTNIVKYAHAHLVTIEVITHNDLL